MDKEQIKEILSCHRPDQNDQEEALIAEALDQAKLDPELWAAMEDEWKFDRDFTQSLQGIPSNDASKQALLNGIGAGPSTETSAPPLEVVGGATKAKTKRIKHPFVWSSVAALLLIATVSIKFFMFPAAVEFPAAQNASMTTFRDHMAFFATKRFTLEKTTDDLEVAKNWLADRKAPVYDATPELLVKLKGMGCREIDWNGTRVSLVCFLNGKDQLVHLFMVAKEDINSQGLAQFGDLKRHHNLETRGWTTDEYVCLLVGADSEVTLEGLM